VRGSSCAGAGIFLRPERDEVRDDASSQDGADPVCEMEYGELVEAAVHLNRALELLVFVNNEISAQAINSLDLIEKLSGAWNEINNCRVYTEEIVYFEELLIPAMGLVNDAKLMLESLIHWKLGMTLHGKISILASIREAVTDGIQPGIIQLESCMA